MLPFEAAPRSVCILRLSAIGDTCHVVPVLRTLQQAWPATRFTWIIAKTESRLMRLIEGVEFIIVDKRAGIGALAALHRQLAGRSFDALLHMQVALRASLIALQVSAAVKLGFDRARARELQWLFTNARIAARTREHVLDSFFGFPAALGIKERLLRWDIPLPQEAQEYARALIPDAQPTLVISPCSSHVHRNWRPERYAAVAEHAVRERGMRVILSGGTSALERATGAADRARRARAARQPDRPRHAAAAAGAACAGDRASEPGLRAGAHGHDGRYAGGRPVRRDQSGAQRSVPVAAVVRQRLPPGGTPLSPPRTRGAALDHKIEEPGVMDLIEVDEVTARLDELLRSRP